MLRRAAACLVLAAAPALAQDEPQWPPPGAAERMRELQLVIIARESTPAQREAAREELMGLLKSPAGRSREPGNIAKRAPRAAIDPFPSVVAPANIAPAPPPPGGIAHIEVVQPPKVIVNPQSGIAAAPSGRFAVDPRTGNILHEAGAGFIDPRTGQIVPR